MHHLKHKQPSAQSSLLHAKRACHAFKHPRKTWKNQISALLWRFSQLPKAGSHRIEPKLCFTFIAQLCRGVRRSFLSFARLGSGSTPRFTLHQRAERKAKTWSKARKDVKVGLVGRGIKSWIEVRTRVRKVRSMMRLGRSIWRSKRCLLWSPNCQVYCMHWGVVSKEGNVLVRHACLVACVMGSKDAA